MRWETTFPRAVVSGPALEEDCRQAIGLRLLDDLVNDLRYGIRQLKRSPAFTAVAIGSLALGIGANAAIFSLMEAALWKPVAAYEPEQLRLLSWVCGPRVVMNSSWGNWYRTVTGGRSSTSFSYIAYETYTQAPGPFDTVFAFKPVGRLTAIVDGQAELVAAQLVSGTFYGGAGVTPSVGRPITAVDDSQGAAEIVAVISAKRSAPRSTRH